MSSVPKYQIRSRKPRCDNFFSDAPEQRKTHEKCMDCYYCGGLASGYVYPVCDYILVTEKRRNMKVGKRGGCGRYITKEQGRRIYGTDKHTLLCQKSDPRMYVRWFRFK